MPEEPSDPSKPGNLPNRGDPRQQPVPLNYRVPDPGPYQTKTPMGLQVVAGFFTWVLGLAFVVSGVRNRVLGASLAMNGNGTFCLIGATLIGIGALAIWLRMRFRWRGFLPGLLLGFGLTCLVPIGIVLIVCGVHR